MSTSLLCLLKTAGTVLNLSISKLSILVFKLAQYLFNASVDVSTPVAPFNSTFVAQIDRSICTLPFPQQSEHGLAKSWLIRMLYSFN